MLTKPHAELLKEFLSQPQVVVTVGDRAKMKLLLEIFDELDRLIDANPAVKPPVRST